MAGVESSNSVNALIRMVKAVVMQPILCVQSLPQVTVQISKFGINFVRRPVVWLALLGHGGFLILPAMDLTTIKLEEEEKPEELPVLEVKNLSDLIGDGAPAEELTPPEEEPPPPEEPPPIPPPEEVVLTDVPGDLPEPGSEPEDTNLEPVEPMDTSAARGNASNRVRNAGPTAPPAPLDFEVAQRGCFFDPTAPDASSINAPLIDGLSDLVYRKADTTEESDALQEQLMTEFESSGDQLLEVGIYAEALLYELFDVNANSLGYVTLLESKGGFGWYAGIWDMLPDESNCFNWNDVFKTDGF